MSRWRRALAIAVASAMVVAGSAVVALVLQIDVERRIADNTYTVTYSVAVEFLGGTPVRLRLPAPIDTRFQDILRATNGASSLSVNRTPAGPFVLLIATGNVTFELRASIFAVSPNTDLTRVADSGVGVAVSIELTADDPDSRVRLSLQVSIASVCWGVSLVMQGVVRFGTADYPGERGFFVC